MNKRSFVILLMVAIYCLPYNIMCQTKTEKSDQKTFLKHADECLDVMVIAAEMADTFQTSGSGVREPMHGEFGYQGGVIQKIGSGYILAVFSGASGEQDEEIAQKGLDLMASFL